MLSYLDGLCDALLARDSEEVRRLLEDPQAATLPGDVRAEALRGTSGHPPAAWVPLHTLRYTHQMAHLEAATASPVAPVATPVATPVYARGAVAA